MPQGSCFFESSQLIGKTVISCLVVVAAYGLKVWICQNKGVCRFEIKQLRFRSCFFISQII